MRFIGTLVALAFIIVALCGCGASVADRNRLPSPFMGFWVGTWAGPEQHGTAQVVITKDGKASGMLVNTTLGTEGVLSGTITEHGATVFVYQYPGEERYTASGTLVIGVSGHLVGLLNEYSGNQQIGAGTVDLTKQ